MPSEKATHKDHYAKFAPHTTWFRSYETPEKGTDMEWPKADRWYRGPGRGGKGSGKGDKELWGPRNEIHIIIMVVVTWASNCILKMGASYLCKLDLIKVDNTNFFI